MPDPLRDLYAGLASLLRAGVAIPDAIRVLRANGTLGGARGQAIAEAVAQGRTLSSALDAPAEEVALVAAGEETGRLDANLERLAGLRTARAAARRRLLLRVLYPLVLFHLAALLIPLPETFWKAEFPWNWLFRVLLVLGPFYAALLVASRMARTERGRAALVRARDLLPGFGAAARHARRATFATVLGAAYESAIPLDRGVAIAANAAGVPGGAASATIAGGAGLAAALAPTGIFDRTGVARLQTAEVAGEIGRTLGAIAAEEGVLAEQRFERATFVLAKILYVAAAIWILAYYVTFWLRYYSQFL